MMWGLVQRQLTLTANDCLDIGFDWGSPLSTEYFDDAPIEFEGTLGTTTISYSGKQTGIRLIGIHCLNHDFQSASCRCKMSHRQLASFHDSRKRQGLPPLLRESFKKMSHCLSGA
jgi:hypothetical protein